MYVYLAYLIIFFGSFCFRYVLCGLAFKIFIGYIAIDEKFWKRRFWNNKWQNLDYLIKRRISVSYGQKQFHWDKLWTTAINGILLPKLFWPTVRKNCSSDREKLLKFDAEGRDFANFLRSLEQFIQTVLGQNNFW